MLNPESLQNLPNLNSFDRVVFCQAPSRPGDDYASVYARATRNLVAALGPSGSRRTVFVSSTSVYADSDGGPVDESTPPDASRERAAVLLEAERAALAGAGSAMVLRLAGLYGPGRHALKRYAQSRPSAGQVMNRVHVEDAASAIAALFERGKSGEVYIGVDDEPVEAKVFFEWLSRETGNEMAVEPDGASSGKRLLNRKLKSLGWSPRYPTFREGYSEILRAERSAGAAGLA